MALSPAANPDEIRRIVGDLDDAVVTTMMRTGNEVERLPHGTVGTVCEILTSREPEPDER